MSRLLFENGAEIKAVDKNGKTAYDFAVSQNMEELAEFLKGHM